MDNINLMEYWIKGSDRDYESMKKNFETTTEQIKNIGEVRVWLKKLLTEK